MPGGGGAGGFSSMDEALRTFMGAFGGAGGDSIFESFFGGGGGGHPRACIVKELANGSIFLSVLKKQLVEQIKN